LPSRLEIACQRHGPLFLQRDCKRTAPRCLISIKLAAYPADIEPAEEIVLLAIFTDIHANRQGVFGLP
jgi:hypothetical protein